MNLGGEHAWSLMFGSRDEASVYGLTGRVRLWEAIWEFGREEWKGFGFASERVVVPLLSREIGGFSTTHAHNGFIAAWLGTGWIGVALLLAAFWELWRYGVTWCWRERSRLGPAWVGVVTVLTMNNLTVLGIGGWYNPTWIPFIAMLAFMGMRGRER